MEKKIACIRVSSAGNSLIGMLPQVEEIIGDNINEFLCSTSEVELIQEIKRVFKKKWNTDFINVVIKTE